MLRRGLVLALRVSAMSEKAWKGGGEEGILRECEKSLLESRVLSDGVWVEVCGVVGA